MNGDYAIKLFSCYKVNLKYSMIHYKKPEMNEHIVY